MIASNPVFSAGKRQLCDRAVGTVGGMILCLCLVAWMPSRATGQQFLEYPDTIFSGEVSAEVNNSIGRCRQLCDERSGCVGFDHVAATNICRMFATVTSARVSRGSFASARQAVAGYGEPANLPEPPTTEPRQSEWLHNGSAMILRHKPNSDGSSEIEIVYDVPKAQLLRLGIRPGSTLFKGTLAEGTLVGNARLTSSRCGIIQYEMQGLLDPASSVPFFLRGAAPKRGTDCSIETWSTEGSNANLRFDPL